MSGLLCFIAYPYMPVFAQGIGQQGNEIPLCQGFILQARLLHLSLFEHVLTACVLGVRRKHFVLCWSFRFGEMSLTSLLLQKQ